jgi:riboflavin biosynthesis pyrimidine reductase
LVEGGAEINRAMLDARLVDTLFLYVAGTVIPGGRSWLKGPMLERLEDAPRFGPPRVEKVGTDVLLQYDLVHRYPMRAVDEE